MKVLRILLFTAIVCLTQLSYAQVDRNASGGIQAGSDESSLPTNTEDAPVQGEEAKQKVKKDSVVAEKLEDIESALDKIQKVIEEGKSKSVKIGKLMPYGFDNIPMRQKISKTLYIDLKTKYADSLKNQQTKVKDLKAKEKKLADELAVLVKKDSIRASIHNAQLDHVVDSMNKGIADETSKAEQALSKINVKADVTIKKYHRRSGVAAISKLYEKGMNDSLEAVKAQQAAKRPLDSLNQILNKEKDILKRHENRGVSKISPHKEIEEKTSEEPKGTIYYKHHLVTIDTIGVVLEHGYISEIYAYTQLKFNGNETKVTFRHSFPTSVINQNTKDWNTRYLIPSDANFKGYKIILSDLLTYIPYKSRFYPSKDSHEFIKTKKDSWEKTLSRSYDIGTVIEGRIYSDVNGVINDQSFGLVQAELSMKVNMITRNKFLRWNIGNWILFNHAKVKVSTARFDSEFDTLSVSGYLEPDINMTSYVSRAYRQMNISASVLHYQNIIQFDLLGGYQLNSTRIRSINDTINNGFNVNIHTINIEPRWEFPIVGDVLTLEASPRFLLTRSLNNGPDELADVPTSIFNPELVVSYHPTEGNNSGAYFRWVLFDNWDKGQNDIMFWQLGYKVSFNEIVKPQQ